MENASKALVIAGAVLVSILTVATGVQVYNSAGEGSVEQVKQATDTMWQGVDLDVGLGEGGGTEEPQEEMITFYFPERDDGGDFTAPVEKQTVKGTTWREYLGYSDEKPNGVITTRDGGGNDMNLFKVDGFSMVYIDEEIQEGATYRWDCGE